MRPYGSGGKLWNLGLSQPGQLSATDRQLWALRKLTGISHHGAGYTRDRASELISAAIAEKERRNQGLSDMGEKIYSTGFAKAVQAANDAGDRWMEQNPDPKFSVFDKESGRMIGIHGTIGDAWITWPKVGSDFHKWLMENIHDGQKKRVRIPHRYADRLEGELLLACESAALDVYRRSNLVKPGECRLLYRAEESEASQAA